MQPQLAAERRRVLAVDFDYVSRQRKRICDDDKMLLSLIAVAVDDACLPPPYFKIVEPTLNLCLSSLSLSHVVLPGRLAQVLTPTFCVFSHCTSAATI